MPMNEARGYARSSLTKEQKRQALASLYGAPERELMSTANLTPLEQQQLRLLLAKTQGDTPAGQVKEFDLNNPPREEYLGDPNFPFMLYRHKDRKHKVVNSDDEKQAAIQAGWTVQPLPPEGAEAPEIELSAADQAEAAEIDAQLKKRKK